MFEIAKSFETSSLNKNTPNKFHFGFPTKVTKTLGALVITASCFGCFVPKKMGDQMQADIEAIRKELNAAQDNLEEQQIVLQEQIERARGQAKMIGEKLQDINRATKKSGADAFVQLEEQRRLIQELTGKHELLAYELSQLQKGIDQLPESESPSASAGSKVPQGKSELIAHGKKLIRSGKKSEARGVFRQALKKWPKEVGVSDEAYFQLGESYYQENKYAAALQEYIKVVEDFNKGRLVDDAYYRIGLCSMKMGNLEDAQVFFKEIIKSYPKSPMVKYARTKLRDVQAKLKKE